MQPGDSVSAVSNAARTALPCGGSGDALPDAVITDDGKCSVPAERLEIIKERARRFLSDSYEKGFEHFPIDRGDLISKTLTLIDEDSICHALMTPSGANEKDHNDLRREYSGSTLSKDDAFSRGVWALKVPLKTFCPAKKDKAPLKTSNPAEKGDASGRGVLTVKAPLKTASFPEYDWNGSFFYTKVENCEDVKKKIPSGGIPTFIYSAQMPARAAAEYLKDVESMSFYTRYAGTGPVVCKLGANYSDAFHEIWVYPVWKNLKFAMRGMHGRNWSAWKLLRSCNSGAENLGADDLMFNFGARAFVPMDVEDGSSRAERTLVMMQAAAASNSPFASVLTENFKFESVVGREFAKKLFLDAMANGWKVER